MSASVAPDPAVDTGQSEGSHRTWIAVAVTVAAVGPAAKGLPAIAAIPVDLVALASPLLFALCLSAVRGRGLPVVVLLVWSGLGVAFLVPLVNASFEPRSLAKAASLVAVTVPLALSGALVALLGRPWTRAAGALAGLVSVAALLGIGSEVSLTGRLLILGGNPIATARAAGLAAIVAWSLLRHAPRQRVLGLAVVAVALYVSERTGSTGPLVALVATILVVEFGRYRMSRPGFGWLPAATVALATLVVLALGFFVTPGDPLEARPATSVVAVDEGDLDEGLGGRGELWALSLREAHRGLGLGIGLGDFRDEVGQPAGVKGGYAHNLFLELWLEGGLVALVLGGGMVLVSVRRARGLLMTTEGVAIAGIHLYVFLNSMLSGDLNGNRLLWFTTALVLVAVGPDGTVRGGYAPSSATVDGEA